MNTKLKTPILLIEDNPADADLIKIYLEDVGFKYELYHTDSLEAGLELVGSKEIEIALLDLSITDCSGFKTLTKFLEKASHIPVIVLTGQNNEVIGNQAIKAGAQDFLVKGHFESRQLSKAIRYAMQRFKTQWKLEELARRLAISERRYSEAQEMAHFGNWEMDIVTNEMDWSDEMFRILGFSAGGFEPKLSEYLGYVHKDDKTTVEAFFESAVKDSRSHHCEHRLIVGGKTIKYVALQARMHFDEYTDKVLLIGAIQDITERKLNEQLIIERRVSAQTARIQEEMMNEMSFHVRTPLNSIINLLFLLENGGLSLQQKEFLTGLKNSVDELHAVLHNLLNTTVLSSESLKVVQEECATQDFTLLLDRLMSVKATGSGIRFELIKPEDAPHKLIFDQSKVVHLLYSLIDVLAKSNPKDQFTTLKMEYTTQDSHTGWLQFEMEDLASTAMDWSVKASDKPSIGLSFSDLTDLKTKRKLIHSIVQKIANSLSGKIDFSNSKKGACLIKIQIPVKVPPQHLSHQFEKPQSPLRILLVDDHFLNQMSTKKVLLSWSDYVRVEIAENGKAAFEMFRPDKYDLILMDIQMPIMNGFEATLEIRKISDVPIIGMSASPTETEIDRAKETGMNDYLSKPFKPQDIYSKILQLIVHAPA